MIDKLIEWVLQTGFAVYAYCTDFVINVANLTGLSYYEINAILFCFLFPFCLILFGTIYAIQVIRVKRLLR